MEGASPAETLVSRLNLHPWTTRSSNYSFPGCSVLLHTPQMSLL